MKKLLLVFALSAVSVHVMAQKTGNKKAPAPPKVEAVKFTPPVIVKDGEVPPPPPPRPPKAVAFTPPVIVKDGDVPQPPPPPPRPPRPPKAPKKAAFSKAVKEEMKFTPPAVVKEDVKQ